MQIHARKICYNISHETNANTTINRSKNEKNGERYTQLVDYEVEIMDKIR